MNVALPAFNPAEQVPPHMLRTCLKDPNHFFEQFREPTFEVLKSYHSDDPGIREALVYWMNPDLEKSQKTTILTQYEKEVDTVRQYLWSKGYEIIHKRKEEAYLNAPWIVRKMTDFRTYLDKDPVVNRCKVYGGSILTSALVFFYLKYR